MSTPKYNTAMGARARARREELGLNTKELAHTLDITPQRLSQMEGDGCQSIDIARKWADALDMDPVTLIFGSTPHAGPGRIPAKRKTKPSPASKKAG